MSYLAIARKYRPATFDEIVGQEHVTQTLRNAITSDRIHHAYLFCGARGVGKTTAARALAKSLNCENGPTPTPCGTCGSCREISNGSSPDLIEIDGASNNSVDDVRELRETVHYAPTRGGYKVYLVDEVHMLSKAAFNALLKTLEEPPPKVVFIFATTEPHRILDTILSRVQRFDFKRIGIGATTERLREIAETEGVTLSDTALRWVARAGDGSMRDAQSLLDKVISFGGTADGALDDESVAEILGLIDRSLLYTFVRGLLHGEPAQCLDAIAQVYGFGHELSQFTSDLLELLRDATFVGMSKGAEKHLEVSEDEIARLRELVGDTPTEQLTRVFNALLDVHDQVSRAMRPRMVLEMAVARLATTRPVQPVSELLARLDQLERATRGGGPPPERRSSPDRGRAPAARRSTSTGDKGGRSRSPRSGRGSSPPGDPSPEPDRGGASAAAAPRPQDRHPNAPPEPEGWEPFSQELQTMGSRAKRIAAGRPEVIGDMLVVYVKAGRALAEARPVTTDREVVRALGRFYPGITRLEVRAEAGTGTATERQRALQQAAHDHPDIQRIVAALGAEVELVTPIDDEAT